MKRKEIFLFMMYKKYLPLIIQKTLLFFSIMIFVSIFQTIFGSENSLVGVSTAILVLIFMDRNLLVHPIRNLFLMLTVNLTFGIVSYIIPLYPFIGLFINFSILFVLAYFLSYELRKPLVMMVGLHYTFLLTTPIPLDGLPLRLLALISGPFIILAVQWFSNKNKLQKSSQSFFLDISTAFHDILHNDTQNTQLNFQATLPLFGQIKQITYNSFRSTHFPNDYQQSIITIISQLEYASQLLTKKRAHVTPEIAHTFSKQLTILLTNTHDEHHTDLNMYMTQSNVSLIKQLTAILESIATALSVYHSSDPSAKGAQMTQEWKSATLMRKTLKLRNIRVRYALRLALLVSFTMFITAIFELSYGRWILYTVFAITQPYSEYVIERSKKRAIGTLIGSAILLFIFSFIHNDTIILFIMLVIGYLQSYITDYRNIVMFVTVSAVASSALAAADPNAVIFTRILFIAIGIVFALIANMFILKTSYSDEIEKLELLQYDIEHYAGAQLFKYSAKTTISYLYSLSPLIEYRIQSVPRSHITPRFELYSNQLRLFQQLTSSIENHPNLLKKIQTIFIDTPDNQTQVEQLSYLRATTRTATEFYLVSISLQIIKNAQITHEYYSFT